MHKIKKILVTGGAGFIGSHLCNKLIGLGHHVYCLDNLYSSSLANVHKLNGSPNFKFIQHDICNFLDQDVDEIYNLACPASPKFYQMDPVKTVKTAVLGTINVLELAKQNKIPILQASTSEVYGDPNVHPQNEKYWGNVNPIGPRSCYDEGKRCAETLFFDYSRQYKLTIKVVRIFNTYGPNMMLEDGRVISNIIKQAIKGDDISIYGNGEQTRCFCYVDDLINALIDFMNINKDIKGPINIGNPNEIKIIDLAKKITQMTKSKSKFKFYPLPDDDPVRRKPDIKLAKNILGWKPKVGLEIGLSKTIKYFKEILK